MKPEKHGGYNIDINGVVKTIIIRALIAVKNGLHKCRKMYKEFTPIKAE